MMSVRTGTHFTEKLFSNNKRLRPSVREDDADSPSFGFQDRRTLQHVDTNINCNVFREILGDRPTENRA